MSKKKTTKKNVKASEASKKREKLEGLQQTTGKDYEAKVNEARELEKILGFAKANPFNATSEEDLERSFSDMNLTDLQTLAVKAGVFPSGNKTVLKNKLRKNFQSHLQKASVQVTQSPLKLDPKNPTHRKVIEYLNS